MPRRNASASGAAGHVSSSGLHRGRPPDCARTRRPCGRWRRQLAARAAVTCACPSASISPSASAARPRTSGDASVKRRRQRRRRGRRSPISPSANAAISRTSGSLSDNAPTSGWSPRVKPDAADSQRGAAADARLRGSVTSTVEVRRATGAGGGRHDARARSRPELPAAAVAGHRCGASGGPRAEASTPSSAQSAIAARGRAAGGALAQPAATDRGKRQERHR